MARATNTRTGLPRRRRKGAPMADFDRLPPALRAWLAGAVLPWSPRSAARAYARAMAATGASAAALAHLAAAEARLVAADAARVWGPAHPAAASSQDEP
jgi:hypothetical protein